MLCSIYLLSGDGSADIVHVHGPLISTLKCKMKASAVQSLKSSLVALWRSMVSHNHNCCHIVGKRSVAVCGGTLFALPRDQCSNSNLLEALLKASRF